MTNKPQSLVRESLQAYAGRGVFRGFSEVKNGKLRFVWLICHQPAQTIADFGGEPDKICLAAAQLILINHFLLFVCAKSKPHRVRRTPSQPRSFHKTQIHRAPLYSENERLDARTLRNQYNGQASTRIERRTDLWSFGNAVLICLAYAKSHKT